MPSQASVTPPDEPGIIKFYVDGVLIHTEYGVTDDQLPNQGIISFGRNQTNRDVRNSLGAFIGEIGPIKYLIKFYHQVR